MRTSGFHTHAQLPTHRCTHPHEHVHVTYTQKHTHTHTHATHAHTRMVETSRTPLQGAWRGRVDRD